MTPTFDDDEREFGGLDTYPRQSLLFRILADFKPMASISQIIDFVHRCVDAVLCILLLIRHYFFVAFLLCEFPLEVHLLVFVQAVGDFAVDARFYGGGVFDRFVSQYAHEIIFLDFGGRGGFEAEADLGLLFFEVGGAALAADFGGFARGEVHWFGSGEVFLLGGVEGDRVLDVEGYDAVGGGDFEVGGVGGIGKEAFVPPFDFRRSLDEKGFFRGELFVDAGFAGGFGDAFLHGFEGGLAAEGGRLSDVFALLVEEELAGFMASGKRGLSSQRGVEIGVLAGFFEGRASKVEFLA